MRCLYFKIDSEKCFIFLSPFFFFSKMIGSQMYVRCHEAISQLNFVR